MLANRAVGGIGIVSAMAAEARFLSTQVSRRVARVRLRDGSLVQVGGIGAQAAAGCALELVAAGVTALASWGLAGGLDPALRPGTTVLPAEVVSRNGKVWSTSRQWCQRLQTLAGSAPGASGILVGGRLLTSPRVIESVADKAEVFRATGAAAVDMESLAIAQVAAMHGLPFIAVRVIIDAADDTVPQCIMTAMSTTGELRIGRLLAGLVYAPADLPALLRLAQRYRLAGRALAAIGRSGALAASAVPTSAAPSEAAARIL